MYRKARKDRQELTVFFFATFALFAVKTPKPLREKWL
jgi:hypothetical protein